MNKVILIGRLTREVETRTVGEHMVARFAVAVDRPFKNANGERETDFIEVVAWRQLAKLASDYLVKGQQVAVEGRLQIRTYQTDDGSKHKAAEVVADEIQFLAKPSGAKTEAASEPVDETVPF